MQEQQRSDGRMDPRFGTIVIDTPNHFLYLVQGDGKAIRYGIGRPGFAWSGVHAVSGKKEWPDWVPPDEMIRRQPYLPHFSGRRPKQSTRCTRALSWVDAVPDPWLERALDDRPKRVVRLHQDAQCGHHRPL
jgi:L,D-transpeptidase-like protein